MIAAMPMFRKSFLLLILLIFFGSACSRETTYPDLRDSHDPELQAELDAALADRPQFWDGVKKRDLTVVIADVTDLEHPKVAWYNPELESRVYNVPGVIATLILLITLLLTAMSVVREREMGTLDQLSVSPLTPTEFILGKTLPSMLVAFLDLFLVTGIAILWFGIPMRGSFFVLLPAALAFIITGLGFGLLLSSVSKTQQEAFMGMFLVLLPAIILSGFFYPISSMPELFQWLTVLNPVRHFLEIIRAVFLKDAGFLDLWRQYVALTVMAVGVLWVAVVRFRGTTAS